MVFEVVSGWDRIHRASPAANRTGQRTESPEASWVTVSFFSSRFCRSKVRDTQSENSSSGWECWTSSPSLKNRMLRKRRISVCPCSAYGTSRYSQDLNAKKMPSPVSWTIALSSSDICCLARVEMTDIGMAF